LNSSKGVVRCRDLKLCTKEEIIRELNAQGVIDSQNITVQEGNGRRQTNTFILTFNTTEPPKYIMVGSYERVKVEFMFRILCAVLIANDLATVKETAERIIPYVRSVEQMVIGRKIARATHHAVQTALAAIQHIRKNAQNGR